jgi:hypothetical protein
MTRDSRATDRRARLPAGGSLKRRAAGPVTGALDTSILATSVFLGTLAAPSLQKKHSVLWM